MNLKTQKKLAASILKCSQKRVKIDLKRLEELGVTLEDFKQAITKADIKGFVNDKIIKVEQKKGTSRFWARKNRAQKIKGKRKGHGSRKGRKTARTPSKREWIIRIRLQRRFIKRLVESGIIDKQTYHQLYLKSKGGFFRSKRHIQLYIDEHKLAKRIGNKK